MRLVPGCRDEKGGNVNNLYLGEGEGGRDLKMRLVILLDINPQYIIDRYTTGISIIRSPTY